MIERASELLAPLRDLARVPHPDRPTTRIDGVLPVTVTAGARRVVCVVLANVGSVPLLSVGDEPVHLASRWFDEGGAFVVDGPRTRLGTGVWPRSSCAIELLLAAPPDAGRYELRIAPVREGVAWFDDVDARNGLRAACEVVAPVTGDDPDGLPGLSAMIAQTAAGPEIYRLSAFWGQLCELHASYLGDEALFHRFKRTVNFFYFQFAVAGRHAEMYRTLLREFLRRPTPRVLGARLAGDAVVALPEAPAYDLPWVGRRYAIYVAMLWEIAARRGAAPLLQQLEEPALGTPLAIRYRGRSISQDLANSALELAAVLGALPAPLSAAPRVLEIGGGYGRLAHVVLSAIPGARYIMVDIAPTLALAQRYLTSLFPDLKAFRFRRFDDAADIEDELAASRIAFLTPDQLELVAPLQAEVALTVSSLHEMLPALVERYLQLVDRHCDGVFYTKQWRRWHNPVDDVVMAREDYSYPARWRRIFERPHPAQPKFFEALFDIGGGR